MPTLTRSDLQPNSLCGSGNQITAGDAMVLDQNWFSEPAPESGTAFSLQIKGKLLEQQTAFQKLEVYETTHFGNLMVLDGFVMLTTRDNFLYHEMMSHTVLHTHPAPRHVAIIGGGDCGTLREVLKHPGVESATQIDIDEAVTRASEKYFPELCKSNDDPRATLLFEDGIAWMRNAPAGSLDVIIVDSTDPIGPAEGLFGVDFYRSCLAALGEQGLLVQQAESPMLHLPVHVAMHLAMQEAGFGTTQTVNFPQPVYPSGWWSAIIAGKGDALPAIRDTEPALGELHYYSRAIHEAALVVPPFVEAALREGRTTVSI